MYAVLVERALPNFALVSAVAGWACWSRGGGELVAIHCCVKWNVLLQLVRVVLRHVDSRLSTGWKQRGWPSRCCSPSSTSRSPVAARRCSSSTVTVALLYLSTAFFEQDCDALIQTKPLSHDHHLSPLLRARDCVFASVCMRVCARQLACE